MLTWTREPDGEALEVRSRGARRALAVGVLVAAVLALYAPSVRFSFVWDDVYFVLMNRTIRSWSTLAEDFRSSRAYAGMVDPRFYRPMRNISYRIDWSLAGPRPAWWHAHNVLLHAVNAVVVFSLLDAMLRRETGRGSAMAAPPARRMAMAWTAALTWAVHPVHTEAVAWVKSRDELLFTLFGLVVGLAAWRGAAREMSRKAAFLAAIVFAALALLSKEMAASLGLLVAAMAVVFSWDRPTRRWLAALAGAVLLETLVFLLVRHRALGGTAMCGYLSGHFSWEMLTMVRAAARYVEAVIWPVRLYADYSHFEPTRTVWEWRWWGALATVVVVLTLLAVAWQRGHRGLAFGLLWFWLALLPVSNVVPTMQYLAERFLYFPTVGVAMAGAFGLGRLGYEFTLRLRGAAASITARSVRVPAWCVVASLAMTLAVGRTATRLGEWRDELTLYAATWRDAPRNGRALVNLAMASTNVGAPARAQRLLTLLRNSSDPVLRNVNPQMLLRAEAATAMALGRYTEASELWRRALAYSAQDIDAWSALGFCQGMLGHHDRALECFLAALEVDPQGPGLRRNAAVALRMLGREREAVALERGELSPRDLATTRTR